MMRRHEGKPVVIGGGGGGESAYKANQKIKIKKR